MSDFERELHDRLAARADAVPVAEEWDDLLDRVVRRSRRTTRGMALLVVLAVCAGTLGVVVAARSTDTKTKDKAAPVALDHVDVTNAQLPTLPALGNQPTFASLASGGVTNGTLGVGTSASPKSQYLVTTPGPGMWIQSIGGGNGMQLAKVFTRTTASGEVIRAYRAKVAAGADVGPPWWKPADYCFPNGYAQADVSDTNIAGVAGAPLYAAQRDGAKVGGTVNVVGGAEQAVQWVVVAQGPTGAAKMRATFPNGSHDEMTPVDGLAMLVGTGPTNDDKAKVKVEALDASGASLGSASLGPFGELQANAVQGADPACTPPMGLPAPGKQQPADPAAAKQAVENTFAAAYNKNNTNAQFDQYFDDAHGFTEVRDQLNTGPYKDQVRSAVIKLDDVVFLSPTEAAIQYDIDIPNYSTFPNRFTEARLINGQWKLARQGWCTDVAMAGVQCPA